MLRAIQLGEPEETQRVAGLRGETITERVGQGVGRLQVTDAELVRRIRAGDESAFRALVDRHSEGLYRMAYSVMGSAADAEDVLQETFLGAFNRLSAFEGRSSVKTWLVRILLNHASKIRRSQRVRKADPLPEQIGPASGDEKYAGSSPAAAVQTKVDVIEMLQTLSLEHREVIVLRELQQMSYDEIAEALRIPRGTVESRLHRARQELKRRYEGYLT